MNTPHEKKPTKDETGLSRRERLRALRERNRTFEATKPQHREPGLHLSFDMDESLSNGSIKAPPSKSKTDDTTASSPPKTSQKVTHDPRGGFGYVASINFTPETSFASTAPSFSDNPPPATDRNPSCSHQPIVDPTTSFADVLVMRNINREAQSFTAPSTKHCSSTATTTDILAMKHAAEQLFAQYADSAEIYHALANRLERMVRAEVARVEAGAKAAAAAKTATASYQLPFSKRKPLLEPPRVADSAVKLRDFLSSQAEVQVEMGQAEQRVQHEVVWAEWLVDAAVRGVLHLKVVGCHCRPEPQWERAGAEDEEWDE